VIDASERFSLPVDTARLRRYYHRKRFAVSKRLLGMKQPLPRFTDYSITPDFANRIIAEILRERPSLIVESGSGLSTIVAGYCLQRLGRGRLISLEHQEEYLRPCQDAIGRHQLQAYVEVVHAPLRRYRINDREWLWYDDAFKKSLSAIEMLIVDGPPGDVQPLSRYPIVPLLRELLDEDVVILMDDGARPDEREIADRWIRECGDLKARYIALEKGLIRLERR
jgi:hypothetical protein